MKKNKMMRAASALLVATLLSTSVISGTFAKYTSEASGNDVARVAKWSFNVGDSDIVAQNTITFNLFDTVNEADTTTKEDNIKSAKNDTVIAPGTGGSFVISLTNNSEVTAKYKIDFKETNDGNVPIEYSTDNKNWKSSIDDLDVNKANADDTALAYNGGTTNITVYWRWSYEATQPDAARDQSDNGDTALGKDGTATVTVSADITATQVN